MVEEENIYTFKKIAYPATYWDKLGEVKTPIGNDGKNLLMELRGVNFIGQFLDDFEPSEGTPSEKLEQFTLYPNARYPNPELCDCELEAEFPMHLKAKDNITPCTLKMKLMLGKPNPPRGLDMEDVQLTLNYQGEDIESMGSSGWFEDELLDLNKKLPEDTLLLCCFNCLYSDYHPVGHGLFGGMLCFKRHKKEYLAVETKDDFLDLDNDTYDVVQEIYICPEFQRRIPGTGYRG